MMISLSSRWEAFVAAQLQSGQFGSEREVLEAGLSLMAQRETKLEALRATIRASLAEGGALGAREVRIAIAAKADELRTKAG